MPKDTLFAETDPDGADFVFDDRVAHVFPDMIRRSVPGYPQLVALTALIAERYAREDSRLYDLGCSLGAVTAAMARLVRAPGCSVVAVDNSEAMIARCRELIETVEKAIPVQLVCADVRDIAITDASVVVLNLTLQFLPPGERLGLLRRIAAGMRQGGVLVLTEKVHFDDTGEQAFQEDMHTAFKQANGYSELEISRKRAALERVLLPDTIETHRRRLAEAGFREVHTWFRCFNFASLVAFR